jgi:hypothetical protein
MKIGDIIRFSDPRKTSVGIITKIWDVRPPNRVYCSIVWSPEKRPYWNVLCTDDIVCIL